MDDGHASHPEQGHCAGENGDHDGKAEKAAAGYFPARVSPGGNGCNRSGGIGGERLDAFGQAPAAGAGSKYATLDTTEGLVVGGGPEILTRPQVGDFEVAIGG